jgi:hypothetical protein
VTSGSLALRMCVAKDLKKRVDQKLRIVTYLIVVRKKKKEYI